MLLYGNVSSLRAGNIIQMYSQPCPKLILYCQLLSLLPDRPNSALRVIGQPAVPAMAVTVSHVGVACSGSASQSWTTFWARAAASTTTPACRRSCWAAAGRWRASSWQTAQQSRGTFMCLPCLVSTPISLSCWLQPCFGVYEAPSLTSSCKACMLLRLTL